MSFRFPNLVVLVMGACVAAASVFAGCGSDPEDTPPDNTTDSSVTEGGTDDGGGGDTGNSTCKATGAQCAGDGDCCSSRCDGVTKTCALNTSVCTAGGGACAVAPECCTFACVGGKCSSTQCTADGADCTQNEQCCGGTCTGGKCAALSATCKSMGNPCTGNDQCCSKLCKDGFCKAPSFCAQTGDACSTDSECCGGNCTKAAGAALGTCSTITGDPCSPAGSVCEGGADAGGCDNKCCSLSCGMGPQGVKICQPPSGCKPQNELCAKSEDCCGGPGRPTGLVNGGAGTPNAPKACTVPAGETFGRCEFLQCLRPGDVCKTTTFACGGTSNNCCESGFADGGTPSPGFCNNNPDACCSQDSLGIPRCRAVNFKCDPNVPVPAGQTCATSADCCGKPCVNLKCEGACVQTGNACTINADCCSGLPCIVPTGSTKGTCGAAPTPPPDAGTTTPCSQYGQACSVTQPCCNGVPCSGGLCLDFVK